MKATMAWPGVLLLAGLIVPAARAQYYGYPPPPGCGYPPSPRVAPDACGPGYFCTGPCGADFNKI